MSIRKPYNDVIGYVCSLKVRTPNDSGVGGHIVIYDRYKGFDCDADDRWIVMHEPSSLHVSVPTLESARVLMKLAAWSDPNYIDAEISKYRSAAK